DEGFRDAHGCALMDIEWFKRRMLGSWLRLRSGARRLTRRRGAGLPLLIALALSLGFLAAAFALTVFGLTVFALAVLGLAVLALRVPAAAFLARRAVGRRRLLVLANDHLGAVGQISKAGRHNTIECRQSAGDHRVGFV